MSSVVSKLNSLRPTLDFVGVDQKKNLLLAKGMLSRNELGILYSLGKSFQGRGLVLDLGSFCGASAYCLGTGIKDSPNAHAIEKPIRCFDLFKNTNPLMNAFINKIFLGYVDDKVNLKPSQFDNQEVESFREIFDFQTASVKEYIQVYEGSILDFDIAQLRSSQLEILNVDVGKSFQLNEFLVRHLFPKVIVGGYVFQQDIRVPDHWYLLLTMHLLRDYFELDLVKGRSGWVYRCSRQVNKGAVDRCINEMTKLTAAEIVDRYYECRATLPPELQNIANHSFCFCFLQKFGQKLDRSLQEVYETFDVDPDHNYFVSSSLLTN